MVTRAKHPCTGMTKAQREAFEQIALLGGGRIAAHHKTIEVLLSRGLISRDRDEVVGRDRFGPISIPNYFVPTPVHMQYCQWCSETCKELTP